MHDKNALRAELRLKRMPLSSGEEGARRSRAMQERLLVSELWRNCRRVAAYVSVKGEAGTALILAEALNSGRELFLPRCRRKGESGWPGGMDLIRVAAREGRGVASRRSDTQADGCKVDDIDWHAVERKVDDIEMTGAEVVAGLVSSPFGIPEPELTPRSHLLSEAELAAPDTLVIVPALAFDRQGFRLGYGGGYYDRLLSRATCPSVGLAFHALVFDQLPRDPWDKTVHAVCTEEALLWP